MTHYTKRQAEQRLCWLVREMIEERKFQQGCKDCPHSSYYGDNARAVKQADRDALMKLEAEYTILREMGYSPKLHRALPPR
jgi:hypothetical protein